MPRRTHTAGSAPTISHCRLLQLAISPRCLGKLQIPRWALSRTPLPSTATPHALMRIPATPRKAYTELASLLSARLRRPRLDSPHPARRSIRSAYRRRRIAAEDPRPDPSSTSSSTAKAAATIHHRRLLESFAPVPALATSGTGAHPTPQQILDTCPGTAQRRRLSCQPTRRRPARPRLRSSTTPFPLQPASAACPTTPSLSNTKRRSAASDAGRSRITVSISLGCPDVFPHQRLRRRKGFALTFGNRSSQPARSPQRSPRSSRDAETLRAGLSGASLRQLVISGAPATLRLLVALSRPGD